MIHFPDINKRLVINNLEDKLESRDREIEKLRFTIHAKVSGGLNSNFVFSSAASLRQWQETVFPQLEKEYRHDKLRLEVYDLPGLQIGDKCRVWGEGTDDFRIRGIIQYSPHRYGFILDSGCTEEVAKCYVP